MPVEHRIVNGKSLIVIDNPPVNVLGQAIRSGLMEALDAAEEAGSEAIVLTAKGSAFVAGADAREFNLPPMEPHLPDVLKRMERLPVIAAINGVALGGGLELALAARMRIAAPGARLGLPEVNLGLVPGAGGTQRLPRLIGAAASVDMISQGTAVGAEQALHLGLVDEIAEDTVAAALAVSVQRLEQVPPVYARKCASVGDAVFLAARNTVAQRMPGQIAPIKAIELVEAACKLPLEKGLALERAIFLDLRGSDQAAALRYAFFAERAAQARMKAAPAVPVLETAVVVGQGAGMAAFSALLARSGVGVTFVVQDQHLSGHMEAAVQRLIQETEVGSAARVSERIAVHSDATGLPVPSIAFLFSDETAVDPETTLRNLERALAPDVPLVCLSNGPLALQESKDLLSPSRILGMNLAIPVSEPQILEITRFATTGDGAISTAFRLAAQLNKIAIVTRGQVGPRLSKRVLADLDDLKARGIAANQIQLELMAFGFDPAKLGLGAPPAQLEGDGRRRDEGLSRKGAGGLGDRITLGLIAEGFQLLEDGLVARPAEIDLLAMAAVGFPRWKGGPMHMADRAGLPVILNRLQDLCVTEPKWGPVPNLLQTIVEKNGRLEDLN